MCHERQVLRLLHRGRREHGPSGGARVHHVAVVAEDRQSVRGHGPRGDVDHGRRELPGDLEQVGDHEQEALRGGEARAQGAELEGPVQDARRARLRLHLDHVRHRAPEVRPAARRPCVGRLAHRRGRRDGVDGEDLAERVGDPCGRLVAVDADPVLMHESPPDRLHVGAAGRRLTLILLFPTLRSGHPSCHARGRAARAAVARPCALLLRSGRARRRSPPRSGSAGRGRM